MGIQFYRFGKVFNRTIKIAFTLIRKTATTESFSIVTFEFYRFSIIFNSTIKIAFTLVRGCLKTIFFT